MYVRVANVVADHNDLLTQLAYLGAYGTHMFALGVWVGDGTSKTFFSCSITLKMLS